MASGGLGFPTKNCAQAFFDGIMDFLEENECITTLKKLNIVILEEPKHKEFQEKWIECFRDKYGDDLPSSDEEAAPEVSSDSEEETKIVKGKKKPSFGIGFDSDEDAKGSKKGFEKLQVTISANASFLSVFDGTRFGYKGLTLCLEPEAQS